MYRRQGSSQKHRSRQTEVKGQKWSQETEVTSSRSLLSGAGVHWLAARPVEPMACAVHPILQRSDPGFRLGCSGRFSWQPPGRHPRRSLRYEESSRSYSGRAGCGGSWLQTPCWDMPVPGMQEQLLVPKADAPLSLTTQLGTAFSRLSRLPSH